MDYIAAEIIIISKDFTNPRSKQALQNQGTD